MSSGVPVSPEWHRESITPRMEDTLRALQDKSVLQNSYLAGGTGLALRFGHRTSVDLDFFVQDQFNEDGLLERLHTMPGVTVVQRAPQTLHLAIQGVKVRFPGYRYPLLFPAELLDNVPIADARDIACMKLTAIASRGAKRDFVDLYSACERFGLAELLNLFVRKYAPIGYNKLHILKSLTYFADAEKDPMPHMLIPIEWHAVKAFFEREVPQLGDSW